MKVLIADDDAVSALLIKTTLQDWGYEVISVSNGLQALSILQQPNAPRLTILDWMMPGINGPEVIRQLREQTGEAYQYIILLTSRNTQDDIVAGLESGADDYLRKPYDKAELRARISAGVRVLDLQDRLLQAQSELSIQASQDALTKLPNRRAILHRISQDSARCIREKQPLGVLMVDMDHFKAINDNHSHAAGDATLVVTSDRMRSQLRAYDSIGRFGGEEFLIILPNADTRGIMSVAERVRSVISAKPITFEETQINVTCSIGAAIRCPGDELTVAELMHNADMALFRSKARGRNRITAAWEETEAA